MQKLRRRKQTMKFIKVKRMLAATLAATMVMASAVTVCASGSGTSDPGVSSEDSSSGSDSGSSSSKEVTYAEAMSKTADAPISVAGTSIRTSVAGVYAATKVRGTAVTASLASVKAALGLAGNQTPAIIIYDTDETKSFRAMECVNAAAAAMGGTVVASLNVDLGAKENGKWVTLSSGSVGLVAGLPKDADPSKEYSVICVQPGGVVTILEDQDTNPSTVTFEVQAGLGTYAIVAK